MAINSGDVSTNSIYVFKFKRMLTANWFCPSCNTCTRQNRCLKNFVYCDLTIGVRRTTNVLHIGNSRTFHNLLYATGIFEK